MELHFGDGPRTVLAARENRILEIGPMLHHVQKAAEATEFCSLVLSGVMSADHIQEVQDNSLELDEARRIDVQGLYDVDELYDD